MKGKMRITKKESGNRKIRKALLLLGTATIMGTASCGAKTAEVGPVEANATEMGETTSRTMRESEVILQASGDGNTLTAGVYVYEPGESSLPVSTQQIVEEVVSACQDSTDTPQCINREVLERIEPSRGRLLPNAQVGFQYWNREHNVWEGLQGVVSGNRCDISNLSPGIIRAVFRPEEGSDIGPSAAVFRIPRLLDSD